MVLTMINADKPHLWKKDIIASVDLFNDWFISFAPEAYRETRRNTAGSVIEALLVSDDLTDISVDSLKHKPGMLQILRMTTAPPLARDRLIGLAHLNKNLVHQMEKSGQLPVRMSKEDIEKNLEKICSVITELLDIDIFNWVTDKRKPTIKERERASTIIADRLCGAVADPIIRNAQEQRQLNLMKTFLEARDYNLVEHLSGTPLIDIPPGTFTFRMNIPAGKHISINIPVDVVIQPKKLKPGKLPLLTEAKSAGDFTNVNKRRKEEATKIRQLKSTYGSEIRFILFLCGYFDAGYLGYEASEGLDWIWEHRIEDMEQLGL